MDMHRLGINTGFAVNRYAEPEQWTAVIHRAGARYIQLTGDILNVSLPEDIVRRQSSRILKA